MLKEPSLPAHCPVLMVGAELSAGVDGPLRIWGSQILIRAAPHLILGCNSDCPREPVEAESQDFQGGLRKQNKKPECEEAPPEDQTAGPSFLSMSRAYPAFPGSTHGQLQL